MVLDLIDMTFLHTSGGSGSNVIIFGIEMSSFTKTDNRKEDVLVLGKGPTQVLQHTLFAKKMYSINFTKNIKKFFLSLHYNGTNSYSFAYGREICKFKAKYSKIVATPLFLGNISKDWVVDKMKKTGSNGYVCDFSADYDAIAVDDILDIHKYLMKKSNMIKKCLDLLKISLL